tara:strand:+ start:1382 stop:1951 length:570 start_codon:yes stop_codon:yes gene_type:complete
MNKRTAFIGAIASLIPLGQILVLGTGTAVTSTALISFASKKAQAEDYYPGKFKAEAYAKVLSEMNKEIEINPKNAEAYQNRGVAKWNLGNSSGAINDYTKVIELNPNNIDLLAAAYANRGDIKRISGHFSGAIIDLNKAIELNPNYTGVYFIRAYARKNSGDNKGACSDWKKAEELGSKSAVITQKKYC